MFDNAPSNSDHDLPQVELEAIPEMTPNKPRVRINSPLQGKVTLVPILPNEPEAAENDQMEALSLEE